MTFLFFFLFLLFFPFFHFLKVIEQVDDRVHCLQVLVINILERFAFGAVLLRIRVVFDNHCPIIPVTSSVFNGAVFDGIYVLCDGFPR